MTAAVQERIRQKLSGYKISEAQLVASLCKHSYEHFVREFWDTVVAEQLIWNWHMSELCSLLQECAERVMRGEPKAWDLIVNIPPGTSKSTLVSVMFPPWVWTRFPRARFICGTNAIDLGMDLSRKSRDVIITTERLGNRPSYQECFPHVVLKTDQNTKGFFMNTEKGMRKSVTVGGKSPIGFHAHFLIVDDPIDPDQAKAASSLELKSANDWMNESLPSRKVDKAITPTILVMQRLHQNDPSGNRLATKDPVVKHISLPADAMEYPVKPTKYRKYYQDGLLDPKRMSRKVLKENQLRMGIYAYAGQFGQQPVPPGGGTFKVERIKIMRPPWGLKHIIRFWDKAGTGGSGAYTVGLKMAAEPVETGGFRYWILDVIRGQWDSAERERLIRLTAQRDGRRVTIGIEQEPGSGGKESTQNTIRRLAGYTVIVDKPTGEKETRADPFSTQVNEGNVYLATGKWNEEYIDELKYYPFSTYVDQVDASSGAFNWIAARKRVGAL